MIKDVMVRLDGTIADDARLDAAATIARQFEGNLIGLFLNILPSPSPPDPETITATQRSLFAKEARETGDTVMEQIGARLDQLGIPTEIRRFDIYYHEMPAISARTARLADTFVTLRPNDGHGEIERIVEGVLFGSGRNLILVPPGKRRKIAFDKILVAWNGSREAARALAEGLPYLKRAANTVVCVIDEKFASEEQVTIGAEAQKHLHHHGVEAVLNHVKSNDRDIGSVLMEEARRQRADLIVMGGYGHSRLREWLLGGVTYTLLHESQIPILISH